MVILHSGVMVSREDTCYTKSRRQEQIDEPKWAPTRAEMMTFTTPRGIDKKTVCISLATNTDHTVGQYGKKQKNEEWEQTG